MANDKCVYEYDPEQNRKYFMLAGGRIELQTKGDGSTARIMTQKEQHPVSCLTLDDYMETVANDMQADIEEYAEQYVVEATASFKKRVEELEEALRSIRKTAFNAGIVAPPQYASFAQNVYVITTEVL